VWRTGHEAENAETHKLVQCKTQEEDNALACCEIVVDKKELMSKSYVAVYDEALTVPKNNKCYSY
jgi:hypothetical protein